MAATDSRSVPPGPLAAAFERVLVHYRAGGGRPSTIDSYRQTTTAFLRYLRHRDHACVADVPTGGMLHGLRRTCTLTAPEPTLADLNLLEVEEWACELQEAVERGEAALESVRSHVRRLRPISERLQRLGIIETHVLAELRTPARDASAVLRVPSRAEVAAMLDVCDTSTRSGRLDLAIVCVLADGGARRSEAAAFDVGDFDGAGGWIRLRQPAKRGTPRFVFLGANAREALRAHLGRRTSGPLFVDRAFERLSGNAIGQRVRAVAGRAGLRSIGPQLLRRFTATELASADGVTDVTLYRIMGWSTGRHDPIHTRYVNQRPEQLAELYRRVSPVDQLDG